MQLEFIIQGQILKRMDSDKPVENSIGYVKARFDLPIYYSGTISAYFKRLQGCTWVGSPVTVDKATGLCDVPDDVLIAGSMYVGLQSTDTNITIPTNAVEVKILASGVPKELLPSPDGTLNEYQDFVLKHTEVIEKTAIAVDSATAAELSEAYAYDSEVNAKASEDAAKVSEDNAKTSETNAANSASTATAKADVATAKASEASASATNATTSATNAASSATTATTKASEASASATNAAASATSAATTAAEAITARSSAIKNKVFDSLDLRLEDIEYGSDTAIVDTKTGTSIQSIVADDYIAELKIEGVTLVTKANPDLDISPDNVATITSSKNFDVIAKGKNIFDKTVSVKGWYNSSGVLQTSTSWNLREIFVTNNTNLTFSGISASGVGTVYICGKDINGVVTPISSIGNKTINTGSFISILYSIHNDSLSTAQLELGSIPTTYEPYKSNSLAITQELHKLPNGVADTREKSTDGKWYDTLKIGKTTLTATGEISDAKTGGQYISTVTPTGNLVGKTFTLPSGATSATVYYELSTPIKTLTADAKLTTYKGTTNIYSTATVQPTITATFKSRLANAYSVLMADITKIKQAIITMGGTV